MRKRESLSIFISAFIFLLSLFLVPLRKIEALETEFLPRQEFYISQDNAKEVEITGNVAEEDLLYPGMVIRVSLEDEVENRIFRTGLIDEAGEFGVTFDASGLLDGEIRLNATVFIEEGEKFFGPGGIKREKKIYDELKIIKDTHSPLRLKLYSVTTPAGEAEQTIRGEKPKETSVWLDGIQIVPLNGEVFWEHRLKLQAGDNRLLLTAKDKGGNASSPVEAIITYDPTLTRATLKVKERSDGSGIVDIEATFSRVLEEVPKIVIDTEFGEDTPPVGLTGSGTTWRYEYHGSSAEGEARLTILLKDPLQGEIRIVEAAGESRRFRVKAPSDKISKSAWRLPPPPEPKVEQPRPEILTTTTLEELDNSEPKILKITILDPFPNYKNGATVHLEIEYEDPTYEVIKNLINPDYKIDNRYTYFEKSFAKEEPLFYPVRADFSSLDTEAGTREIQLGEAAKIGNTRWRRTVSYKISPENRKEDGELTITLKVNNFLGKTTVASVSVRLFNEASVSLDKDILVGFEEPIGEDISEITLKGSLKTEVAQEGYIALFIYSEPLVKTIKTDKTGNWTHTLQRPLESGEHLIYGAEVELGGELGDIVQLASFIVPAVAAEPTQAVNIEDIETAVEKIKLPSSKRPQSRFPVTEVILFLLLVVFLGVVLSLTFGQEMLNYLRKNSGK